MQRWVVLGIVVLLVFGVILVSGFQQEKPMQKVDIKLEELDKSFNAYDVFIVEPYLLKAQLDKGTMKISIRGQVFEVEVKPTNIVTPGATNRPIYTYTGKIIGKKDSFVSIVISDNVFLAYIKDGKNYYVIDQTNKKYNGKVLHIAYSSKDVKITKTNADLSNDVIRLPINKKLKAISGDVTTAQVSATGTVVVDLLAAYDSEFFWDLYPNNPEAEIAYIVNTVNEAFAPANVQLRIRAYREYTTALIPNGHACEVLERFVEVVSQDRDSTNSDLAFLFSGKDFLPDNKGHDALGCSFQYNGYPDSGFAVGQMVGLGFSKFNVAAHELGHNFDADHENTGGYNQAYWWIEGWYTWHTLMYSNASDSEKVFEFSNRYYHGDTTHDNIRRISETAPIISQYR